MSFRVSYHTSVQSLGFRAYLGTLFLGALNDNLFKMLIVCLAMRLLDAKGAQGFVPMAGACFILPYVIFSRHAGYLADRCAKRQVMVWTKVAEIVIMLLGMLFFKLRLIYGLLGVLFLMGTQSTYFSPAKYGFLPEVLAQGELSRGNGLTQLFTFLPIIIGSWLGGVLSSRFEENLTLPGCCCVVIAVVGWLCSLKIAETPQGNSRAQSIAYWKVFGKMRQDGLLMLSLLGNTYFWFLGAMIQLSVPFLTSALHGSDALTGNLMAAIAIGIGLGCATAGYLSKDRIGYGLVCPGGLATGAILLLSATTFRLSAGWCAALLATTGFACGFFQLPLGTSLQQRCPAKVRGSYLAVANVLDSLSITLASLAMWLIQSPLRLGIRGVLTFGAVLTIGVTFIIVSKSPAFLERTRQLLTRR
jgi:acyl-[acyl-carrier-protein]-phospholipid O-acyltransferase/long-chain-fatty-acid--[acyl-carrier-protein] ligase